MSMESDIEMLFLETLEEYAKKQKLKGKEVADLFRKYKIYEKILVQYEYLHQVSFEEVMEYVEEIINNHSK